MAIFKCKMCGGNLEVPEGASSCTCDFCGTQQTIPTVKDEDLQMLFNRANVLRMKSEFDKAAEIYEKILQRSDTEAEAYWGLILCKYGIEYVEDPKTFKRIPTCHRASYDAVTSDEDYKNAVKYADAVQKGIYKQQAKEIDKIQKGIIALAQKEDPYDVFICYKEMDESGKRTQDSVIANDIYYQLTREGFKVFYAAITLEDKLGSQYESYIFSALNTAKVMLALGTKPEYFNAVWVKNEWSRFLKIMRKDRSKILIPCYRDMDPYELPEEFAHLQAQDMSKIGFINDLVRGIKKVIVKGTDKPKAQETVIVTQSAGSTSANAQVKRGNMALEDHEWDKADSFFEEALNLDPECAEAYIGKLLAREQKPDFVSWIAMQKEKYRSATTERLEAIPADTEHIEKIAKEYMLDGYLTADTIRKQYEYDRGYDSELSCRIGQKVTQQNELATDRLLARAKQYAQGAIKKQLEEALENITTVLVLRIKEAEEDNQRKIEQIKGDYYTFIAKTDKKIEELKRDAQIIKQKKEQSAKKRKTIIGIIAAAATICIVATIIVVTIVIPNNNYNAAVVLMHNGDYEAAIIAFEELEGYKDSNAQIEACKTSIKDNNYHAAVALMDSGDYIGAYEALGNLNDYKDSTELQMSIKYDYHKTLLNEATIGENIFFGTYEQDNNTSNGKEDIEWIVLAKENDRVLVTSKYALDCQPYNISYTDITWESCSLRGWLNSTFLSNAFTDAEQACIPTVTVTADKNPEYSTNAGNDTQDQVFLLSITEAEKYFSSELARQCKPTSYAVFQGAYVNVNCRWWLRSPGDCSEYAATVGIDGSVSYGSRNVNNDTCCVRPAMWINLESK